MCSGRLFQAPDQPHKMAVAECGVCKSFDQLYAIYDIKMVAPVCLKECCSEFGEVCINCVCDVTVFILLYY